MLRSFPYSIYAILCFPMLIIIIMAAQSPAKHSPTSLDSLLQDYALRALLDQTNPRTGIVYNVTINHPANLTGIQVSALRLRSGSLRKRGFQSYKEFHIPIGIFEHPLEERLVLVYQNLGNWSSFYYPLPGYTYLSPVVGLLAYDAPYNLSSATNALQLDLQASSAKPILIRFQNVKRRAAVDGVSKPMCVYFDAYGSVEFDNVLKGNVCSTTKQGHSAIVVEFGTAPSPAAAVAADTLLRRRGGVELMGCVVGGVVVLVMMVVGIIIVVIWVGKCRRSVRIQKMEESSQGSVALSMTSIGYAKVPIANMTRTKPTILEEEYHD